MNHKYLLLKLWTFMALMGILCTSTAYGQATLKHSYTFEDGTAADVVGGADGVLHGDAVVANGVLTISGTGFVSLPGKQIDIPSYNNLTVEVVFNQASDLIGVFAMLLAFGETNPAVDWMGINYWMFQPVREDAQTRTAISCLNTSNPWATETGVNTKEINDDFLHYITCILTDTDIKMYIDGAFKGSAILSTNNHLVNVSNDTAYIGASVYPNDAKWRGIVEEVNIWEGAMNEAGIKQRASVLLGDAFFNAKLSALSTIPGNIDPSFSTEIDIYEVYVPYGTPYIGVNAIPSILGATIAIFDGLGNDVGEDGRVYFTGDGIDLEIVVTALDGNTELSYYLSIFTYPENEASTLSKIQLSKGAFTTDFHPDSTEYTAILPYGTTSVNLTAVPVWAGETVSGGGIYSLSEGTATATITVTSENGVNTTVYTVTLYVSEIATGNSYYFVHEASEFVIGESQEAYNMIKLYPAVKDDPSQLFSLEESGEDGQYFLKNQLNKYMTLSSTSTWDILMSNVLPQELDSSRFILEEFEPGRFKIQTVARLGLDNYLLGPNDPPTVGEGVFSDKSLSNVLTTWNIKFPVDVVDPYDTYLSDLSIDISHLRPDFAFYTKEYYVTLPIGTTSITIGGVANDPTTTITGTGTIDVSNGKGTITVTVTATDTQYATDYFIYYQVDTPLTLKHSYTFADGTARDMEGSADGEIQGGSITDGVFTSGQDGDFIVLPSEDIALNTYPSITLETWVTPADNTNYYAMLAYFGGMQGANSLWMQIARGDETSRFEMNSRGAYNVNAQEPAPESNHHYVGVVTNDSLFFYVDGMLVGKVGTGNNTLISGIDPANGWLFDGGYAADPSWQGSMYEFNIFSGQMDAQTVAIRSTDFPIEDSSSNATLKDLMLDGVSIEGFASYSLSYDVILPKGTTNIPLVTATTRISTSTAQVTDATEIPGTATVVVTSEDGIYSNTYRVNFEYFKSSIATLSDLTVDGTTIEGFDPEKITYTVMLAIDETEVPEVVATLTDENATVKVNPAISLPGTTTVVVTAEDGITKKTYSIKFALGTSIKKLDGFSVKVYPTISSDGNFRVESSTGRSTITVYDIAGKVVLQNIKEANQQIINIPHQGMYIVKVEYEGVNKLFKVFKTQ